MPRDTHSVVSFQFPSRGQYPGASVFLLIFILGRTFEIIVNCSRSACLLGQYDQLFKLLCAFFLSSSSVECFHYDT